MTLARQVIPLLAALAFVGLAACAQDGAPVKPPAPPRAPAEPAEPDEPDAPAAPVAAGTRHELQLGTMKALSGDSLVVTDAEDIGGDVYAWVGRARIEGEVEGDLMVGSAGTVEVPGLVVRDLDVVAQRVVVEGRVGSRMRAVAFKLVVGGEIGADAVVVANSAHFEPSAQVRGSLAVYGGTATLEGSVDGPVWVGAGQVEINGRIAGDATVTCDELKLGPAARIEGNLTYDARGNVDVPPGAVAGKVIRREHAPDAPSPGEQVPGLVRRTTQRLGLYFDLYLALTALVAGVMLVLFFRPAVEGAIDRATNANELAVAFGVGLVAVLALVVVGILCCLLFPLAIAVFAGLGALAYFGGLIGKMILGGWVLRPIRKRDTHPLLALLTGVGLMLAASFVPVLGDLFWFVVTMIGMGAVLLHVRGTRAAGAAGVGVPPVPPPAPPAPPPIVA